VEGEEGNGQTERGKGELRVGGGCSVKREKSLKKVEKKRKRQKTSSGLKTKARYLGYHEAGGAFKKRKRGERGKKILGEGEGN